MRSKYSGIYRADVSKVRMQNTNPCKGFVEPIMSGKTEDGKNFIVLEKLGPSLKNALKERNGSRFSKKTVIQIGIQLVSAWFIDEPICSLNVCKTCTRTA